MVTLLGVESESSAVADCVESVAGGSCAMNLQKQGSNLSDLPGDKASGGRGKQIMYTPPLLFFLDKALVQCIIQIIST